MSTRKKARAKTAAAAARTPTPPASATPAPSTSPPLELPPVLGASEAFRDKLAPYARRRILLALAACVVAWGFGFAVRAVWHAETPLDVTEVHRGDPLIGTEDGYYYAAGVRFEVEGFPDNVRRVPDMGDNILVAIGAFVVEAFGTTVHAASLWLSALLAPLVAVPLVLLGLLFGRLLWGFFAALVAVIGFSYWNRTFPGYFDTDMVAIPYVFGTVAMIITALWRRSTRWGTAAAIMMVFADYVHPGSQRVLLATAIGLVGYALVFNRREQLGYRIATMLFVASLPLPFWVCILLVVGLELALSRIRPPPLWVYALALLALAVVLAFGSYGMQALLRSIGIEMKSLSGGGSSGTEADAIAFRSIGSTVLELSAASASDIARRLMGGMAMTIAGAVGIAAMCWRHRPLLMFLPLVALGTLFGGQRFTIFAMPVFALGAVWLAFLVGRLVVYAVKQRPRLVEIAVATLLMPGLLAPALGHALAYPRRTALTAEEAELLTVMSQEVGPDDYMIAWWDYAYGIWYFAGVSTIIDGAKQNEDIWIVSEALFTPSQREAAALSRMAAEAQPSYHLYDPMVRDLIDRFTETTGRPAADFVPALRDGSAPLPPATRDVFLYLPWRLLPIASSVARTRVAEGLVPQEEVGDTMVVAIPTDSQGNPLIASALRFDAPRQALIDARGREIPVQRVIDVGVHEGRLATRESIARPDGEACVVNVRYNQLTIYLSRSMCASVMTQLLLLGRPDPRYFELAHFGRGGFVYRIKL